MQQGQRVRVQTPEGELYGQIHEVKPLLEQDSAVIIELDPPQSGQYLQFRPWQLGERFFIIP